MRFANRDGDCEIPVERLRRRREAMPLEQEPRLSLNVPSKWTNRFIAVRLPHGVRIAFAEAAPGEDKAYDFHSAIVMTWEDARALAERLLTVAAATAADDPHERRSFSSRSKTSRSKTRI
jgi:hypothetical protein